MASQLSLNLEQPLRYSSNAYLLHSGVAGVITSLVTLAYQRVFSLAYVQGGPRAGKTHTAVYLVGHLKAKNKPARMFSGDELLTWHAEELTREPLQYGETVVIDDGDLFLKEISKGGKSGVFMDLMERLLQVDGTLVLFGVESAEKLGATRQIQSRLSSGLYLSLGDPVEAELDSILNFITKQRGLQFSEAKRSFILRRVARTVPALVDCVERVEGVAELSSSPTSFTSIAGALAPDSAPLLPQGRKNI